VYENVNPLFERTMDVNVADRFVDHAAFVNWYVSVVGLVVVLPPAERVVPVGVPTTHENAPDAVPVNPRLIENLRSVSPVSVNDGIERVRFGVLTETGLEVTDRPVSCLTNFTWRVYVVALSAEKLDVI
jgi:hypothetical protein